MRARDARRVRVLTATTWPNGDDSESVAVVRTRHCAPALGWFDLAEHVTRWALRHGCEVEHIVRCADSGAAYLRVFSPDGRMAWEWAEPREACAECGMLAPLVQRDSGHVETDCACQSPTLCARPSVVTFSLPQGTRLEFPSGHRFGSYEAAREVAREATTPSGEAWIWRDEDGDDPLCYVRDGRVIVEADEVRDSGHDCGAVTVDPYVEVCTACGRVIGGAR